MQGEENIALELKANEFLVEIIFRSSTGRMDAMKFVTNKGRESAWFGNTRGGSGPHSYKAEAGHQILSFGGDDGLI